MLQLSPEMMQRYEIADHRPERAEALILGADRLMLGCAAPLLDEAGVGAVCVTTAADMLSSQGGLYTLLLRGEAPDGSIIREERVIQSILRACAPESGFSDIVAFAGTDMRLLIMSADADAAYLALAARACYEMWKRRGVLPEILIFGEQPENNCAALRLRAMAALSRDWTDGAAFADAMRRCDAQAVLADRLCAALDSRERSAARQRMNYRDDFIAWAEPENRCAFEKKVPALLSDAAGKLDFAEAGIARLRVLDALIFLCAGIGYLSGKHSFSDVLDDETLRGFIGRAFTREIMPELPLDKERADAAIIAAFARLQNHQNDMPLTVVGRGLLRSFPESVLPAIRARAKREFEAPKYLTFALAATVMLYAGARLNAEGQWEVARGKERDVIDDDPVVLSVFATLSHDMPAETLCYAVLADRTLWGEDLREIPGLEMQLCFDISAIQRSNFIDALRNTDTQ